MMYSVIGEIDVWTKNEDEANEYASLLDVMIIEIERHGNGRSTIRFVAEDSSETTDFIDGLVARGIEIL